MRNLRVLLFVLLAFTPFASAQSDAKATFTKLKSLAGNWEGKITTEPKAPEIEGQTMKVSLRVTSMGNMLMHEMTSAVRPDDPITTMYLDEDKLMLTHYCDAGNRPRMVGKSSADGKKIEFEFLDVSGSTKYGHMHHAAFTILDADRHTEDWVFMSGDKPIHAHIELKRVQ